MVTVLLIPLFFLIQESPMFLYKAGKVTDMIAVLQKIGIRNKAGIESDYFEKKFYLDGVDLSAKENRVVLGIDPSKNMDGKKRTSKVIEMRENFHPVEIEMAKDENESVEGQEPGYEETNFLRYIFSSNQNIINLVALFINSAAVFVMYYGLASSVQDLGLPNIQFNGILMAVTSLIGSLFVATRGPKLKRVSIVKLCSFCEVASALVLAALSFLPKTQTVLLTESGIAAFFLPMINQIHLTLTYIQISELMPTRFRGLAVALVLLFGKAFGAVTPYTMNLFKNWGFHVVVGCSYFSFAALPISYFMKETLGMKKMY